MPRVGVILSGCGVYDGAEIHESVLTLLALDLRGVAYQCMAPDKDLAVVNHRTGEAAAGETRNVLDESARIARGQIVDLAGVDVSEFDAFVLPGGFGAAKNLCTFAVDGANCDVDPAVQRVLTDAHAAGKPLGFACIAPAVAARVFGKSLQPQLTIGHDQGTAAGLEALGAKHVAVDVEEIVVDQTQRIVSTPAYMEAKNLAELNRGIDKMVEKVLQLVANPAAV